MIAFFTRSLRSSAYYYRLHMFLSNWLFALQIFYATVVPVRLFIFGAVFLFNGTILLVVRPFVTPVQTYIHLAFAALGTLQVRFSSLSILSFLTFPFLS
jgi:hypothetical protein